MRKIEGEKQEDADIMVGNGRRESGGGENVLSGLPIAASSCLFCSGNADTVTVKAKAAAMVFVKYMTSLLFSC